MVTVIIWKHVLQLWSNRNGDQHGRPLEEQERQDRKKLRPRVSGIDTTRERLPVAAARQRFDLTVDERMRLPISQLQ